MNSVTGIPWRYISKPSRCKSSTAWNLCSGKNGSNRFITCRKCLFQIIPGDWLRQIFARRLTRPRKGSGTEQQITGKQINAWWKTKKARTRLFCHNRRHRRAEERFVRVLPFRLSIPALLSSNRRTRCLPAREERKGSPARSNSSVVRRRGCNWRGRIMECCRWVQRVVKEGWLKNEIDK